MTTPVTRSDRPDTPLPAALAMQPRWQLCRDVRAGTQTMRDQKTTYLPKFEAEHPADWHARVAMTVAYEAFGLTIDTLVGLAFTTEPEFGEDMPPRLRDEWENIDGEGTHGTVFFQQVLDSALQDGHCGVLAEFPPAPSGRTLADELRSGDRAYLVRVTIDQILSWLPVTHGGRRLLGQVVLRFKVERPDGPFGVTYVHEYRVYRQVFDDTGNPAYVEFEVWEDAGNELLQTIPPTPILGPTLIPFAIVFGGQPTGFLESRPPLLGLAYSNVEHTQLSSDQAMLLHKCAVPVFVVHGLKDKSDLVIGNSVWTLGEGADAKVLEITGTSLDARRQALLDIERRMADQGVAMLQRDGGTAQTATEAQLRENRRESKLSRAVRSLQDAAELALGFMARYYGLESGGSLIMRRDFSRLTLSDADVALLNAMRDRGDLTHEKFLEIVRLRGPAFEGIDPEAEAEAVRRSESTEDVAEGEAA